LKFGISKLIASLQFLPKIQINYCNTSLNKLLMQTYVLYTQIGSSILLVLSILLQSKSAGGLSATFGGGGGNAYSSKRGIDKLLANSTILFAILFFASAIAYIFV
jgi:protein translocase SecG subunit